MAWPDADHVFGFLEAYTIDRFTVDLAKHAIILDLSVPVGSEGQRATTTLTFTAVSHCYYVHTNSSDISVRFPRPVEEVEPGDYVELSEIVRVDDDRQHLRFISRVGVVPSIEWKISVAADIWRSHLFIRAKQIEFDGVSYVLGYS